MPHDYQTYPTRRDARQAGKALRGWPLARIVNLEAIGWVLECAAGRYLRTDGYVR